MKTNPSRPQTIDAYIADFPPEVQAILEQVRRTIQAAAPDAIEAIRYQIPTYVLEGNLIFFAGYKQHIAVYPRATGNAAFQKQTARYVTGKGTYRFPLDEPIPYDLITKITQFRLKEHLQAAKAKKK